MLYVSLFLYLLAYVVFKAHCLFAPMACSELKVGQAH